MRILVVNAGSSSLKLRLLDDDDALLASEDLRAGADGFDRDALTRTLSDWPRPDAVGHRIVHGGAEYTSAVQLSPAIDQRLRDLIALAPLHQPKSLDGLSAVSQVLPDVPGYACFDTAFHTSIPPRAHTYAVPREWRERYGVRRYGFHGLSHAYASRRGAELAGLPLELSRIVTCHLGAGASLCAVLNGASRDTTMGFTPLEGLVMATRSGSIDPGLVLWLEEHENLSPHEVATALEQRSGLLALTGVSSVREVEKRAEAGDPAAVMGLDVYLYRIAAGIAAMAVATEGIDVVVFTGGVGEHSAPIRSAVAQRLAWLGMRIDDDINTNADGDADITGVGAAFQCVVVAAREDLQIAHEIRALMAR